MMSVTSPKQQSHDNSSSRISQSDNHLPNNDPTSRPIPRLWITYEPNNQCWIFNPQNVKLKNVILLSMFLVMCFIYVLCYKQIKYEEGLENWRNKQRSQFILKKQRFKIKMGNIGKQDIEITPYLKISKIKLGFDTRLQVGTNNDPLMLKQINFKELETNLSAEIKYSLLLIENNLNLQTPEIKINRTQFKNDNEIQNYVQNLYKINTQNIQQNNQSRPKYNLAVSLVKNSTDQKILEAQYYYANKNYKIGEINNESSFCIFSNSYQIITRDQYKQYFQSLELLNYTNFHIVYVDDNSPDQSGLKLREYLRQKHSRLVNRISIVVNNQHMGALANMFFWVKKFCKEDDIVVSLDADDAIIGRQALKILNSVYQDQNLWIVYSSNLIYNSIENITTIGSYSRPINSQSSLYRSAFKWSISPIRTFRKKLFDALPIYSVIEYHYDRKQGAAWPSFFSFASDVFVFTSLLQMAGEQRVKYIQDVLYYYIGPSTSTRSCYLQREQYDNFRSRIKTPLKKLTKLGDQAQRIDHYQYKTEVFVKLRRSYYFLGVCQKEKYQLTLNSIKKDIMKLL